MDHKKRERYSKEFRQQAVDRMNTCHNIARLSRELGVARHLLYHWRDRLEHAHAAVGRFRELILRKQILALKRMLATRLWKWIFSDVPCKESGLDAGRDWSLAARYLRRNKNKDTLARQSRCRANVPLGTS